MKVSLSWLLLISTFVLGFGYDHRWEMEDKIRALHSHVEYQQRQAQGKQTDLEKRLSKLEARIKTLEEKCPSKK